MINDRTKGTRDGPNDKDKDNANVRIATWLGCVRSSESSGSFSRMSLGLKSIAVLVVVVEKGSC